MLRRFLQLINREVITPTSGGLPERAYGASVAQFLATAPRIEEFWTPVMAIDGPALGHNIAVFAAWARERGLAFMPHGKTTMSPALWQRQLDAGAAGITLATLGQVRMGRAAGLRTIHLANEALDRSGLAWLAGELADDQFRFTCWVDSLAAARQMEEALQGAGAPRRVDVLIELGAAGGRTGLRSLKEARELAEYISRSRSLRLAGVGGYEGVIGADRTPEVEDGVRRYLADQVSLHHALADLYDDGPLTVTAGGSAFVDLVAQEYARGRSEAPANTTWMIRSGAYLTHDEGHYRALSPLDASRTGPEAALRPALTAYARVVSTPEPGLVIADAGRRDVPYDLHLPVLRGVSDSVGGSLTPLEGEVTALNDQHMFVRMRGRTPAVGSVLGLGISHPCTAFDKWVYLPVVDGAGNVTDLVRTFF